MADEVKTTTVSATAGVGTVIQGKDLVLGGDAAVVDEPVEETRNRIISKAKPQAFAPLEADRKIVTNAPDAAPAPAPVAPVIPTPAAPAGAGKATKEAA